jgi:hypothetical protein
MVSRGSSRAPARCGARESERQWKCTCVSARVSPWGAPGRTSSQERGTAGESCCWQAGSTRGGSGGGGATWISEERASAGWGAASRVLGRHVAQREAAWAQLVLGTWPARAAGHGREQKQREEGAGGRRRGLSCNFPKVQGLHCKA